MQPEVWGPPAWTFLHTITLNYPENPTIREKENYSTFFNLLSEILPCDRCKAHYKKNIEENPIKLDSKEELTKWLFDIHNKVNESRGKSLYDYDDFIDKYSEMYNPIDRKRYLYIIIVIILLLIFLLYRFFN